MNPTLNKALAIALDAGTKQLQAHPLILQCSWCDQRSNPRATLDDAIQDLSSHLNGHPEWVNTLVNAWIVVNIDGMSGQILEHEMAGRKEEAQAIWEDVQRIERNARKDLLAAIDEFSAAAGR